MEHIVRVDPNTTHAILTGTNRWQQYQIGLRFAQNNLISITLPPKGSVEYVCALISLRGMGRLLEKVTNEKIKEEEDKYEI